MEVDLEKFYYMYIDFSCFRKNIKFQRNVKLLIENAISFNRIQSKMGLWSIRYRFGMKVQSVSVYCRAVNNASFERV